MNKVRTYPTTLMPVTVVLLALFFFLFNAHNRQVIAGGPGSSTLQPDDNLNQFVGCWNSGVYTLYIAAVGGELKGKIRHGDRGLEDPQKIYDIKVKGTTMTGRWESDLVFKSSSDPNGKKRRGTFMLTREGNQLNGTALEGDDSEVEAFRGTKWPWNWTRKTDTKMCEDQGSA
jgi:hypothetical protein